MKQLVLCTACAVVFGVIGTPCANAEQYVRTVSGKVRCTVEPSKVGCQYPQGFPQAPVEAAPNCPPPPGTYLRCGGPGLHWDIASVTTSGAFQWQEGNLATQGTASPQNDVVLNYGQSYALQGWTINPGEDGTRFTKDGTGHGMFVSVDNVYSF